MNARGSDFIKQIADCKTSYDILRLTREFAKHYCFDYFTIIRLPRGDERTLASVSMITNWPSEMTERYDAKRLMEKSPVCSFIRRSVKPIVYSDVRSSQAVCEATNEDYYALWDSFGVREGITVPVHHVSGQRGVVSLNGSRGRLADEEIMEISFHASLIYERLVDILWTEKEPAQTLSQRERECLQWTASGKTSQEIAMILGLSEHTVNHYLNAACQKLGAANRPHAVAKAIRARVLD